MPCCATTGLQAYKLTGCSAPLVGSHQCLVETLGQDGGDPGIWVHAVLISCGRCSRMRYVEASTLDILAEQRHGLTVEAQTHLRGSWGSACAPVPPRVVGGCHWVGGRAMTPLEPRPAPASGPGQPEVGWMRANLQLLRAVSPIGPHAPSSSINRRYLSPNAPPHINHRPLRLSPQLQSRRLRPARGPRSIRHVGVARVPAQLRLPPRRRPPSSPTHDNRHSLVPTSRSPRPFYTTVLRHAPPARLARSP